LSGDTPKVDVGIPTHGRGTYLAAAVESVVSQEFEDWRLTISYNDASSTEPPASLEPFLSDPRVRFDPTGRLLSAGENHTRLVRAGDAPYLAILHDDDLWQPTFLSSRVRFLEGHPEAGWVFSETAIVDERGVMLRRSHPALRTGVHQPAEFLPELLRFNYAGVPSRVLIRRAAFDAVGATFDDRYLYWDWELWTRLAARFPTGYLPDTDVATRIHSDQSTFRFRPDRNEQLRFRDHMEEIARDSGLDVSLSRRDIRRPRSDILLSQALDHLEDGHRREAISVLRAALRAYPPSLVDPRVPVLLVALALGRHGANRLARARNRVLALGTRRGLRFHRR
jgi:glycosyltransferase involved in cell wall biosynthesis